MNTKNVVISGSNDNRAEYIQEGKVQKIKKMLQVQYNGKKLKVIFIGENNSVFAKIAGVVLDIPLKSELIL